MTENQELNISSGHPVQFQIEGQYERHFSTLVGLEKGGYLLIKTPKIHGFTNDIYSGLPIIVRYIFQGTVFGFKSKITGLVMRPVGMIILEFPEKVETHNLRAYQRSECYIPIKLSLGNGMTPGILIDISAGGCRVWIESENSKVTPEIAADIELKLAHEEGSESGRIKGQIRNMKKDDSGTSLGIQFDKERPDLTDYIDSQENRTANGF